MPHRRSSDDDTTKLTPIYSDEPIAVTSPRAKLQKILILYALLPLVTGAIGAYIATKVAYNQSTAHTDARFAALEQDLAQRRKAIAEANARRDAQQAQVQALICTVMDRIQPRDDEVERLRAQYGCTATPPLQPGVTPTPDPPAPNGAGTAPGTTPGSASTPRGGQGGGTGATPRAAPAPTTAPRATPRLPTLGPTIPRTTPAAPKPTPTPSPSATHLVCLPLVGCLG